MTSPILSPRFLNRTSPEVMPEVSLILLDWNVRESFHTLDYLNRQSVARESFEILWLEYYRHEPQTLHDRMARVKRLGQPDFIDQWIVCDQPDSEIYHKHRLYNLGILNSRGRIVVILDSDALIRSDFVAEILRCFPPGRHLALHFEQIRNFEERYYPFNYPTVAEMNGPGCVNAVHGIPKGIQNAATSLKQDESLWHRYNYGACLAALREDLIRIGGADEHDDYLGYICGPYELTARMINLGIEDCLHDRHFLYHAYHPSQGGGHNYCGPNNGRGMSLTAMAIPASGRVLPLVENPQIAVLRGGLAPSSVTPNSQTTSEPE